MSMLSKNLEKIPPPRPSGSPASAGTNMRPWSTCCLAMTEDDDAVPVLKALWCRYRPACGTISKTFIDTRLKGIITQNPSEPFADRGLPAGSSSAARRPRPVVGPQGK